MKSVFLSKDCADVGGTEGVEASWKSVYLGVLGWEVGLLLWEPDLQGVNLMISEGLLCNNTNYFNSCLKTEENYTTNSDRAFHVSSNMLRLLHFLVS